MARASTRRTAAAVAVTPVDSLSIADMRAYLSKSVSSYNKNKVHGILAEVEFRRYVTDSGYGDRVSAGGWIARCDARGQYSFGQNAAAFFPELIRPGTAYPAGRSPPQPQLGLHTICATFQNLCIESYFCAAVVEGILATGVPRVTWRCLQLGLPTEQQYQPFPESIQGFNPRGRRHNYLRNTTDTAAIPDEYVPDEFSKECARIAFSDRYYADISDIDGLFWGRSKTYPLEIKEKTRALDRALGGFFGLDIGPFVKLSYYAAKRGNMHSMFVVREIDNEETRNLVAWRYIPFERLAEFASWNFIAGGRNMKGGASATVRIPVDQFETLDAAALRAL